MVGTDQAARRSGRFKCVVQDQQVVRCAGSDRAGTPLIVAELDQQGIRVELLDHSSDLPACQLACWNVCEEGDEPGPGPTGTAGRAGPPGSASLAPALRHGESGGRCARAGHPDPVASSQSRGVAVPLSDSSSSCGPLPSCVEGYHPMQLCVAVLASYLSKESESHRQRQRR